MSYTNLHLGTEAAAWMGAMAGGAVAFLLAALRPLRYFYPCLALALTSALAGALGYWRPSGWPGVGFTHYSDAGWELRLKSEWFFVAPLFCGALAVGFAVWRRKHCHDNVQQSRLAAPLQRHEHQ